MMKYDTYLYFPDDKRLVDTRGVPMSIYDCCDFMHELADSETLGNAVPVFWPTDVAMPKRLRKAIGKKKRRAVTASD